MAESRSNIGPRRVGGWCTLAVLLVSVAACGGSHSGSASGGTYVWSHDGATVTFTVPVAIGDPRARPVEAFRTAAGGASQQYGVAVIDNTRGTSAVSIPELDVVTSDGTAYRFMAAWRNVGNWENLPASSSNRKVSDRGDELESSLRESDPVPPGATTTALLAADGRGNLRVAHVSVEGPGGAVELQPNER